MLYLPPRIAHFGVAIGDCMTYSIGFRAPSDEELISGYLSSYLADVDPLARYADPDLRPPDHPGEIADDALEHVRRVVREAVEDREAIDRWFGRFITEPRRGFYPEPVDDLDEVGGGDVRQALESGRTLVRVPGVRFAFERRSAGSISLFVAGEEYELDGDLAAVGVILSDRSALRADDLPTDLPADAYDLMADLVNQGFCDIS
jgi:50S ribosomal protein L16 3-hydroxylase